MGSDEDARAQIGASLSCAYVAFETMRNDRAHIVNILEVCDAFTTSGIETKLLVYPQRESAPSDTTELRSRFGLKNTPQIVWIPILW